MLTVQNAKTTKGEALGYLTGILYMAPTNTVSGINTCPMASQGCKKACLYSAGRGRFSNVQQARIKKTELFRDNKVEFFSKLIKSIDALTRKAKRENLIPCIRLNGTSDIQWEKIKVKDDKSIFELYPHIQFYDYTKIPNRITPDNYHLTFSRSETNESVAIEQLGKGYNVAAVFQEVPSAYRSFEVIVGDDHDLRFLDKKGVIVGLFNKGDAKKDLSGFVIKNIIEYKIAC
jgi:hypothetical protein